MTSGHAGDIALQTCITLEVPDTPLHNVSVLASGDSEETFPLPAPWVEGRVDAVRTGRGLGIINTAFASGGEQFVARIDSPSRPVRFSFALSPGSTTVSLAGERRMFHVAGGQSTVLSVPSPLLNVVPPRHMFHNLCILVDGNFMESCLGDTAGAIASELIEAMKADGPPYSRVCAITPCMQMVLQQILSSGYTGSLRRFYLEAKSMELLTMRLHELAGDSGVPLYQPLHNADLERIHQARELITERSADPPSLHEIAAAVGVNCNKLKYGFRETFGTTVFGYVRNLRLEEARHLLDEGGRSVTEVAFEVGYSSLSHFARIFKQTYGTSPHYYARQSASSRRESNGSGGPRRVGSAGRLINGRTPGS
ncbi:MAG: helix-turn-helix transcriptional regulator [Spirochaetaceae bacterium]